MPINGAGVYNFSFHILKCPAMVRIVRRRGGICHINDIVFFYSCQYCYLQLTLEFSLLYFCCNMR